VKIEHLRQRGKTCKAVRAGKFEVAPDTN